MKPQLLSSPSSAIVITVTIREETFELLTGIGLSRKPNKQLFNLRLSNSLYVLVYTLCAQLGKLYF